MKYAKGDLVAVEWEDHFSFRNQGWTKFSDLKPDVDPEICYSAGVVIIDGKKTLSLAQNWHPTDKVETNVADIMTIMKPCIRKVTILKKKVI